jgi:HK97 gp10 family phage protein
MPSVIGYAIKGAREMESLLLKLGPRLASRAGDKALRAAAQPIAKEARRRVPKRTKELARSIVIRAAGKGKGRGVDERLIVIGFLKPTSRRAHLTEFGTFNQPAQPFMRPALDTRANQALFEMGRVLADAITKEATALKR